MITFDVEEDEDYKTRDKVCKLIRDGKCLINDFYNEIENDGNLCRQLEVIEATLETLANGGPIPSGKYKPIGKKIGDHQMYELKYKDLRLYIFKDVAGQIQIIGGKKGNQSKDISRAKKILKEYHDYQEHLKKQLTKK
jgi:hypothetical protein